MRTFFFALLAALLVFAVVKSAPAPQATDVSTDSATNASANAGVPGNTTAEDAPTPDGVSGTNGTDLSGATFNTLSCLAGTGLLSTTVDGSSPAAAATGRA